MIYGIGIDIVAVERMQRAQQRFGDRLVRRILHPAEWRGYQQSPRPECFLAKRWAAKEAVAKAIGTGLRQGLTMSQLSIDHSVHGQPRVACEGIIADWLRQRQAMCCLSISDERQVVCAVAVVAAAAGAAI